MLIFVGDGTKIGLSRAVKDFDSFGGSPSAGRIEECLGRRPVVGQHNAASVSDGSPALWRLEQDPAIYLIGNAGGQIESLGFPFTHVTQREGPRHHRLSLECCLLVRAPVAHLGRDYALRIGFQTEPVHDRDAGRIPQQVGGSAIGLAVDPDRIRWTIRHEHHGLERGRDPAS